ncbi:MAG: AAA family ATPase [Candidatus Aminicenantes bacterium]|nr:AAA family ATPase [Candidatus Aminicenantes bacterium]
MKLAITGKGGTGKTTIAGLLAHYFKKDGYQVLAVDADPDSNLASAIGIPEEQAASIVPISKQRQLIQERTGAKPRQFGQLFKLNPTVKDIPDEFSIKFKGIKLLIMGGSQKGGDGCACPENVLLRSLLSEIILSRREIVIVDMEAGIEHLGRATAQSVDRMLIVVESSSRSIVTAKTIMNLAREIGIESFGIIGNKIQDEQQKRWLSSQFSQNLIMGTVSYHEIIRDSDLKQQPLIEMLNESLKSEFNKIYQKIFLPTAS